MSSVGEILKGGNFPAPRITEEHLESVIASEDYYVFQGTTLTVCCLTLKNGYNVVGHSAAASPANFDEKRGREIARLRAKEQIYALEGYLLRELLSKTSGAG